MRNPFGRFIAAAAMTLALSGVANAQPVSIGTSPAGSLNHSLGNALGKVLGDVGNLQVRVIPYGGGQKILPAIDSGSFDLMISSSSDAWFAYNGKEEFDGKPTKKLRVIGVTFPYYLAWFVRKDAPYKTIADLKGKKVAVGYNGSISQRRSVLSQMAAFGLTEADFDGVQVPHVVRGADDLAQGKVEATSFAVGAGKVAEVNVKVGGIRYLDFENTPEALARMRKVMPAAGLRLIQPDPAYVGILKPTMVQTEPYMVVAGAHVSDEVAYKVAKVLYENRDDLAKVASAFKRYEPNELTTDHEIPFHPGAIRLYTEKGAWPADRK